MKTSDYKDLNYARRYWVPPNSDGRLVSYTTMWRWASSGLNDVRLQTIRVGRRMMTTKEWCEEFFRALSEAHQPEELPAVSDAEFQSVGL